MRSHRIGILGGSGFVGFSLAKHLSSIFDIKILDIKEPKDKSINFVYESCDIRNYEQVTKALTDVDLAIHAAIVQIPLINEHKRLAYEVNFVGTDTVCRVVDEIPNIKGMILTGSWHTIGEKELAGVVDEEFGFRPDKVEDRARLYALSKIAQEVIVRFYDEMSDKIYGIVRTGTVLGEGMHEQTAANIFIAKGLKGESITPYKHSMYRPMLYVDMKDVSRVHEIFARKMLHRGKNKTGNNLPYVVNLYYPDPVTIMELAKIVRDTIMKYTKGKIRPPIRIIDQGIPPLFTKEDKNRIKIDITKAKKILGTESLTSPRKSIEEIVRNKLNRQQGMSAFQLNNI